MGIKHDETLFRLKSTEGECIRNMRRNIFPLILLIGDFGCVSFLTSLAKSENDPQEVWVCECT